MSQDCCCLAWHRDRLLLESVLVPVEWGALIGQAWGCPSPKLRVKGQSRPGWVVSPRKWERLLSVGLLCPQDTRDWNWAGSPGAAPGDRTFPHSGLQETSDLAYWKALWGGQD